MMTSYCLFLVLILTLVPGDFAGIFDLLPPLKFCCKAGHPGEDKICYTNEKPFRHLPLPICGEYLMIKMTMYTKSDPTTGQPVTRNSFPNTFDPNKLTMFFSHGWVSKGSDTYIDDVKKAVVNSMDINFVMVDWKFGSINPNYAQSASNTRSVGTEIGLAAEYLISHGGGDRTRMMCVGHSLGSHVCGHAGHRMKFGRIIGLDPAGPLFDNFDINVGLNPSCADRVEAWHTNGKTGIAFSLGTMRTLGHVDIYPNGGGRQPECRNSANLPTFKDIMDLSIFSDVNFLTAGTDPLVATCSHIAAVRLFEEAVKNDCFFIRQKCSNQNDFSGSCKTYSEPIQMMGMKSINFSETGIFYLETNSERPYCQE